MTAPALRPYQTTAVHYLQQRGRAGLFLDMGLGKTAITLRALQPAGLPALVVAPKRVAENVWDAEAALWRPDLRVQVVAGSAAQRARALQQKADIFVISRDNVADAVPYGARWNTLILDELSGFKSWRSNRFKTVKGMLKKYPIRNVWGLTGTPMPNGFLDLWAQVYLLDGGARLGKNITAYRNRFFTPGRRLPSGIVTEWVPYPETEAKVHSLLDDICLSMTAESVKLEMPATTYNIIEIPLPPKVRRTYKAMKQTMVADLELLGVYTASTAAATSNRLAQITAGFLYDDVEDRGDARATATTLHTEKVTAVQEIVEGTGSPVLVFYRYEEERLALQRALPQAKTANEPNLQARWNAGDIPVLLAHPASAGHGLNLQHGGHTIVWTSLPNFDLELWQQANKRLARPGQKNPVIIHVLQAPKSIDVVQGEVMIKKANLQDALLAHLESPL